MRAKVNRKLANSWIACGMWQASNVSDADLRALCMCRYMASRQFLGDISIDWKQHTLDLHVSTNMADAQRPDWHEKVHFCPQFKIPVAHSCGFSRQ